VKVALFPTCVVDALAPQTGVSTVRMLRRAGHQVEVPDDATCCGQNVETLAHVAMIARFGDEWVHSIGAGAPGTVLLPLTGAVAAGVVEVAQGNTVAEAVDEAGGLTDTPQAVLPRGYFGGWVDAGTASSTRLDAAALRASGATLGCGVVSVPGVDRCRCARDGAHRLVSRRRERTAVRTVRVRAPRHRRGGAGHRRGVARPDDLSRVRRWAAQLGGRGACHHPDGGAAMLLSALEVFAD
jgi:NADH:ubiquinone oxidoreductase subunit F (NADH-binding)